MTVHGADQSFVVEKEPPTVSIDDLPDTVTGKNLGPGRLLTVQLTVSEPATITLDILSKRGQSRRHVRDRVGEAPPARSRFRASTVTRSGCCLEFSGSAAPG